MAARLVWLAGLSCGAEAEAVRASVCAVTGRAPKRSVSSAIATYSQGQGCGVRPRYIVRSRLGRGRVVGSRGWGRGIGGYREGRNGLHCRIPRSFRKREWVMVALRSKRKGKGAGG